MKVAGKTAGFTLIELLVVIAIIALLMAGRCLSATHVAAAAGKSMGNCMATGHAAGVAAAMCARANVMPRQLRVTELQAALRADGVDLDMKDRDQTAI